MKTIKKTIAILSLVLLTFSCSKDDSPDPIVPPPTAANTNFIRCTVDGVPYEITGNQVYNYKDAAGFNIAFNNTVLNTGIDMAIKGVPAVRTYTCNSSNYTTVGRLQYQTPDTTYTTAFCSGDTGIVTITSVNGNTIEGTFNFTCRGIAMCHLAAKVITNGTFKITYR